MTRYQHMFGQHPPPSGIAIAFLAGLTLLSACMLVACTTPDPQEVFNVPMRGGSSNGDGDSPDASALPADASFGIDAAIDPGDAPEGIRDCGEAPAPTGDFTRQALRSAAAECAAWQYCEFENSAIWLEHFVRLHAAAPDDPRLTARARAVFVDAMVRWSELELYQFGPAASPAPAAGRDVYHGQSYRDRIYAWPTVARCRVEEQIVSQAYAENGFDRIPISGRGLYALEYLLFYEAQDTACAASSATAREWEGLSPDELSSRKGEYAVALAGNVLELSRALSAAWSDDDGSFRDGFVSASAYPDEQEAMNVLAWALTYIEKEVKDWKLGIPAGYTVGAPVAQPETPHAGVATENLRANLRGFRSLFQGCGPDGSGIGFDDWLIAAGHTELAQDILAAMGDAQAALDALPPLHAANAAEIEASYQALRALSTLLKAELLGPASPLNLQLPASLEGDTD